MRILILDPLAKATEKCNKNTKMSCLLAIYVFIAIHCKTYCNVPNANHKTMKVATKLMKIVLFCTSFEPNVP